MAESEGPAGPLSLAFLGPCNSIHLRRWVGFMAERGHRVTLLVAEGRKIEPGLPESVAIVRFTPLTAEPFRPLGLATARRSLRRALVDVRPDVLNAHFLTHGYHAWLSGFHPYVVTLWGSDILVQPRASRFAAFVGRIALRAADLVMANSEPVRLGALELGAPPDRLEMVQWGVDLDEFQPGPDPTALRARLGLVGRRVVYSPRIIGPIYRQQVVLDALARLPADVSVVMSAYRSDNEELAAVRARAASLGLGDRLVIVPEIDPGEIVDYFRMADVVVSIPASDSSSSAILEALACEKQIVAGDLPSVREWLGELDPAALVPVDDPAATAAALRRALDRQQKDRAELGRRARAIVSARADQAKSLAYVESLYVRLVNQRHAETPLTEADPRPPAEGRT